MIIIKAANVEAEQEKHEADGEMQTMMISFDCFLSRFLDGGFSLPFSPNLLIIKLLFLQTRMLKVEKLLFSTTTCLAQY